MNKDNTKQDVAESPAYQLGDVVAPFHPDGIRRAGHVVAVFPRGSEPPLIVWRLEHDLYDSAPADKMKLTASAKPDAYKPGYSLLKAVLNHTDYVIDHPDYTWAKATIEAKRTALRKLELARVLQHRAWELIFTPFDNPDLPGWSWCDDGAAAWFLTHARHAEEMVEALYASALCALTSAENDLAIEGEAKP